MHNIFLALLVFLSSLFSLTTSFTHAEDDWGQFVQSDIFFDDNEDEDEDDSAFDDDDAEYDDDEYDDDAYDSAHEHGLDDKYQPFLQGEESHDNGQSNVVRKSKEDLSKQDCQTHLDIEPTAVVNNTVNVISGLYQDMDTDFTIPGAEPFCMQRCYVSADTPTGSPFGKGWNRSYFGLLQRWKNKQGTAPYRARIFESLGALYLYQASVDEKYQYKMPLKSFQKSATNCGSGFMSGRTNIRNNTFSHKNRDRTCLFQKGSGAKLTFTKRSHHKILQLTHELKPNGNQISYSYKEGDAKTITALNRSGAPLDTLEFIYDHDNRSAKSSMLIMQQEIRQDTSSISSEAKIQKETTIWLQQHGRMLHRFHMDMKTTMIQPKLSSSATRNYPTTVFNRLNTTKRERTMSEIPLSTLEMERMLALNG